MTELDLEARADVARTSLFVTLEELDRRRHEALDVRHQLRAHLGAVLATTALGLVVATVAVAFVVRRAVSTRARRRSERWQMLQRAWRHPERVARERPSVSFWWPIGRSVLLGLASRAVRG